MNNKHFVVYDYETSGATPWGDDTWPVELSAIVIHPRTLEKVDSFHSFLKPPDFNWDLYKERNKSTIEWHTKILGCSFDDVLNKWENNPPTDIVWNNFTNFLTKYHENPARATKFSAPIPVGYNITNFDNIITRKLAIKYKSRCVFSEVYSVDLLSTVFMWFENNPDVAKYNFDTMRDYFGMKAEGAHTAINDTEMFADLFVRFMKLIRSTSEKVKFKDSFYKV